MYKKPGGQYYPNLSDKRKYFIRQCNGNVLDCKTNGFSLQEFYNDTVSGLNRLDKNPIIEENVLEIFKFNGKSLNAILAEINN